MKKQIGLFLMCGTLFFASCSDSLLDTYEPGALTEDVVVQSPADLELFMNTAYASMTPTSEISFNTQFSDESSKGFANGGQGLGDILTFVLNSTSGEASGIWTTNYITLAYVNRAIKFSTLVTVDDAAEQLVLDKTLAEAYTMRAHLHLQLLTYYSTDPKDLNALGVLLSNDVYPTSYTAPRVTNGEIYALIDADIASAESLYAANASIPVDVFRANKNFTQAVKSRSYAIRGDYANALTAAQNVIDNSGLTLTAFNQYMAMFHNDVDAESIFKQKQVNGGDQAGNIWASVNTTLSGSPFFEMGRSLYNDLNTTMRADATSLMVTKVAGTAVTIPGHTLQVNDMFVFTQTRPSTAITNNGNATIPTNSLLGGKVYWVRSVAGDNITLTDVALGTTNINFSAANFTYNPANPGDPANQMIPALANDGDIRYSTLLDRSSVVNYNYASASDFATSDKLVFRKYPGAPGKGTMVNDIKISRLSEIYLLKAEAQAGTGDLAGAAATVQQVRNRRFNRTQDLPVYASAADAFKDILYERKKELAAEGWRFIDLKRLGALAGVGIQRDPKDCELLSGACSLPTTDYRFALPIPQVESNPNPGILAQQNPGY